MGLFDKIFGKNYESEPQPDIQFGRYTDSYKSTEQYDAWDVSLEKFEEKEYLQSFEQFLFYLNDKKENNVTWSRENGSIDFQIYQGSKKITGQASGREFRATAKVAKTEALNIGFMRRLVESNFELKYSKFALDADNDIVVVFSSSSLDSSPYKLYFALKELATHADKQDDLLLDEFESLKPLDNQHVTDLPIHEKETKFAFLQEKIKSTLAEIENGRLSSDKYPGATAYLLLDLCYRLDFLVSPEGYMTDHLERMHRKYFENDGQPTAQKNLAMQKEFINLMKRPKEDHFKEMYRVKATFGITSPVNLDKIVSFIDGELGNMDWYHENNHDKVALAIPGYIIGYCLFNYAVPKPALDLFILYYQITEPEYFEKLGFTYKYSEDEKLNAKAIKNAFERIEHENKELYTEFRINNSKINFTSLPLFAKSFLEQFKFFDLTKRD